MNAPPAKVSASHQDPLLTDLLKAVSRSFYITLRALPKGMRRPISLGYLLARTSDTIADTEVLPPAQRLASLRHFGDRIAGRSQEACDFSAYLTHQARPKERELLDRVHDSLALLGTVDEQDQSLIREVLATIISGQTLDLERFQAASESQVVCLQTADELDDYTYRVAGCVGDFWTRVCFKYLSPDRPTPSDDLLRDGIRFGKGLQLVNILRDLSEDLAQGRCYLPEAELRQRAIDPQHLSAPEHRTALTNLFEQIQDQARDHLQAGWQFTNRLPWSWMRMRLACAWPILIGFRTLDLLPSHDPANPTLRAKVSRKEVKRIIASSALLYPFPKSWSRLGQG